MSIVTKGLSFLSIWSFYLRGREETCIKNKKCIKKKDKKDKNMGKKDILGFEIFGLKFLGFEIFEETYIAVRHIAIFKFSPLK